MTIFTNTQQNMVSYISMWLPIQNPKFHRQQNDCNFIGKVLKTNICIMCWTENLVFQVLALNTHNRMMTNDVVRPDHSTPRKLITNNCTTTHHQKKKGKWNNQIIMTHMKKTNQNHYNFQAEITHLIRTQSSPNWVCPKMWLPGYNLQPFPMFANDPTVQNGPIDTPWTKSKINIKIKI